MDRELEDGEYIYNCPHCGSDILYNKNKGMLECKGCGVLKAVGVLEEIDSKREEKVKEPDVLLTARRNEENYLLKDLERLGNFESSGFRDVVIGEVENKEDFLEKLNSGSFPSLSKVVPVDRAFDFSSPGFEEVIENVVGGYAKDIEDGDSFKVNFTRRGLGEEISSQNMERNLGSVLWKELEDRGKKSEVDLEDPDKIIVIESLGELFLVGFLTREMLEKYYALDFL